MCQIFIFGFCLCQRPETIVDLKLFSLFADAANSRTDGTVAKGILMLFFFIFTLFLFSLLNIADFFKTIVCLLLQERKEFEDKYSKEQGAMREQLQVSRQTDLNFMQAVSLQKEMLKKLSYIIFHTNLHCIDNYMFIFSLSN